MIIVKLMGGLGNQMFQYAVGRSVSLSNPRNKMKLDLNFLQKFNQNTETFTPRAYELGVFKNANLKKAGQFQLKVFLKNSILYRILRALSYPHRRLVVQRDSSTLLEIPRRRNLYLDGYFQSEKYFKNIRAVILSDFSFPSLDNENKKMEKMIKSLPNSVSIHIRRGDYLKEEVVKVHGILPLDYYYFAIKDLKENISGTLDFFVFSDDPEWAKGNLICPGVSLNFIGNKNVGLDSWKDMYLMSCCKHHIVGNSSFSWWGAWLSEKEGLKYAPVKWFNPQVMQFNIKDIVPEEWKIIQYE